MENENNKKSFLQEMIITIPIVSILFLIVSYCNDINYNNRINNFKGETIGYAAKYVRSGKALNLKYYYYIDGQKIIEEDTYTDFDNSYLKKFYLVKFNLDNPKQSQIIIEHPIVTDSIKLTKAGFTKIKTYYYDDLRSTYKEKWEWK